MTSVFAFCSLVSTVKTLGLVYQSNVETSTEIILRQGSCVIHETFVCHQSHRTNDRMLINVAAQRNRCLNITAL